MSQIFNWSLLTGFDFFISYKRSEAGSYARRLEELLRAADFRCFLDDNDAAAGDPLSIRIKSALKRSKVLILIASPNVGSSDWVAEEVRIFSARKGSIIPINIGGGLQRALQSDPRFRPLGVRDVRWLEEATKADMLAEPSPQILGELQKNSGIDALTGIYGSSLRW
ncbi:MAG TPA: toll/interleukin-1 receptor domain-containing protein [Bryobacteraceae bacterium]|nr:toll/interleukin-1 receptor domain-containing protein [Bryobacteraceae bacterium]